MGCYNNHGYYDNIISIEEIQDKLLVRPFLTQSLSPSLLPPCIPSLLPSSCPSPSDPHTLSLTLHLLSFLTLPHSPPSLTSPSPSLSTFSHSSPSLTLHLLSLLTLPHSPPSLTHSRIQSFLQSVPRVLSRSLAAQVMGGEPCHYHCSISGGGACSKSLIFHLPIFGDVEVPFNGFEITTSSVCIVGLPYRVHTR